MQNTVVRFEGARSRSLSRLWNFTVRDLVFLGESDALTRLRREIADWAIGLREELDLSASLRLANDPFFLSPSRDKKLFQRLSEAKYELTLDLPFREEHLAVSSFNLHADFYCKTYGIELAEDRLASSACMGFGLERWVYAFLAQKSLDPRNWPKTVQSSI